MINIKNIYITDSEYFENSSLKNPILFLDHKLQKNYSEFYKMDYDLRLLVTKAAAKEEKKFPFYNNYREKYGSCEICSLKSVANSKSHKKVFLNGFDQRHFEYIVPFIKETVEVLYLFKCPKINDLSALHDFRNLKCLFVFWNNTLENLWDMERNKSLKIISFIYVTKLHNVSFLENSSVEYIAFDSSDNYGNKTEILYDKNTFNKMPNLKHLTLSYRDCNIDY